MKCFVIDLRLCMGCHNCQIACKDEHCDNDWSPYAKPQPMNGQFWLKIDQTVRGTVPKVKVSYLPKLCMHCDDAPCMSSCDVKGAIYKRDDGLVIIDPEKCTGCGDCIDSCPYHVIYFNEKSQIAQKCTGCAHLLDEDWVEPRCADSCPTDAILFGEESDLKSLIEKAEILKPESMTRPRVYYIGLPRKFVAGTVYDPDLKEVIIGAKCTLKDTNGADALTVKTDNFGDFWFTDLDDDCLFTLTIAKAGKMKSISSISTEKDVNLGDIALS